VATAEQTFEHLRSAGLADLDPDIAGLIDREFRRPAGTMMPIATPPFFAIAAWPIITNTQQHSIGS